MTQRNGQRISTAHAYLHPNAHRGNLHVATSCHVTRVLFDANKGARRSLLFSMHIAAEVQMQLPLAWSTVVTVAKSKS